MKVLHVIPSLAAAHGGPTNALFAMERALLAEGVLVTTATTDDDGAGDENGKATGTPILENGVERWYFRKWIDFYKVSPALLFWLVRNVRRFDLVHIHALFSFSSVAAAFAARRAGVPYVIRPLGTLAAYGFAARRPWLKRMSFRMIEGPLLRDAAAVHFTSDSESSEAARLGIPMNAAVVPLGLESAPRESKELLLERWPQLRGSRCVLFLSRLDAKKNVEGLLTAFSLCAPVMPDVKLVIAGDGSPDYVTSLHRLGESLGLQERVLWTGHIDGALKASAFSAAEVFVLPSFSENFGIAAAEALMAEVPCVLGHGVALSAPVAAARAGLTVTPDANSIAEALRRLMGDEQERALMATNAAKLAFENYSVTRMGSRLRDLYRGIVGNELS